MNLVYNIRNPVAEQEEREKVFFTNFDFVNEIKLTKEILEQHIEIDRQSYYGQFTDNERNVLFNMVVWFQPKKIIEFSPSFGYTTITIAGAATTYGGFETFETYEFDPRCVNATRHHLNKSGFNTVKVVEGDVLEAMDLDKLQKCDFFFIDSDHDRKFVEKYVEKFFHLIPKGIWVAVHDIAFDPPNGETEVITEWLKKNNRQKYFYVRDLANRFGVEDRVLNPLNGKSMENSTTLWWKNE